MYALLIVVTGDHNQFDCDLKHDILLRTGDGARQKSPPTPHLLLPSNAQQTTLLSLSNDCNI